MVAVCVLTCCSCCWCESKLLQNSWHSQMHWLLWLVSVSVFTFWPDGGVWGEYRDVGGWLSNELYYKLMSSSTRSSQWLASSNTDYKKHASFIEVGFSEVLCCWMGENEGLLACDYDCHVPAVRYKRGALLLQEGWVSTARTRVRMRSKAQRVRTHRTQMMRSCCTAFARNRTPSVAKRGSSSSCRRSWHWRYKL